MRAEKHSKHWTATVQIPARLVRDGLDGPWARFDMRHPVAFRFRPQLAPTAMRVDVRWGVIEWTPVLHENGRYARFSSYRSPHRAIEALARSLRRKPPPIRCAGHEDCAIHLQIGRHCLLESMGGLTVYDDPIDILCEDLRLLVAPIEDAYLANYAWMNNVALAGALRSFLRSRP